MTAYLKKELELQLMYLPIWLDEKKGQDWILWKKIYKCNNILMTFFKDEIFDEDEIMFVMYEFNRAFERIPEDERERLYYYYKAKLDDLMEIVLEEEEYRIAHNLKGAYQTYFESIFIKNQII